MDGESRGCYAENSPDARCCGVCYFWCPAKHIDKDEDRDRCDWCPNDFSEYWYSGYVQTTAGYGNQARDVNGVCCWLCFPLKFPIFFPCFVGSLLNMCFNALCATTCCASCAAMSGLKCCASCAAPVKRNYLF